MFTRMLKLILLVLTLNFKSSEMKKLINLIILGFLTISCSDEFLDRNSLTGISNETFWKTEKDAVMGLTSCYDGLQNNFLYNGGPWEKGFAMMDNLTDNGGHFNWDGWMAGYDIANGTHTPTSLLVGSFWSASYEVINRCNTLISRIDGVAMDEGKKELMKAEAVVLRSLMYTNLTMTYQDVPFVRTERGMDQANVEKTNRSTIVDEVMVDLKNASAKLPISASARGRVTKGAALSILGRLALYNEKWNEAIDAYKQVVQANTYSLYNDYSKLFTQEGESSNEIVFGVRFEGPGLKEGSSFAAHWDTPLEAQNGTLDLAKAFYCTDGKSTATSPLYVEGVNDLANNRPDSRRYENRDLRLKATLFVPGMKWGSSSAEFYGGAAPSKSTIYVYKYYNPNQTSNDSWDSGQDFYVIRYAEVLLSLAEAMVQKDGYNEQEVYGLVNQVRERAKMPKIEHVEGLGLSKIELLDLIKHERRVETAFEGLRLFDLYRWKQLEQAVANIEAERKMFNNIGTYFLYEKRNFRGPQEYIWPIPQAEIDANMKLGQHDLWK